MKTEQAPLVTLNGLGDPVLPIPRTKPQMIDSSWLTWLEQHNRFRFENPDGAKFTAYKSGKGYWTAQRRIHGKLRHQYLGASGDLAYETLNQIAKKMDMGDLAYWREKYPDPRAVHKPSVESHNKISYETVSDTSSQTVTEIEDLKRQIAELKATCKHINLDCKIYKLHGNEVVKLDDLTKLGYKLQRNLLS
jgi:hypothetical protein